MKVEHVIQPALLVPDMDDAIDLLATWLGMYPSERVDIRNTGVNNAVYALGGHTFLELIEPYDPESAAYRLLARDGPGWHMLSVDLEDAANADVDTALEAMSVRVVRRASNAAVKGAWHLHPKDTFGVLLNLANRTDHDDNSARAGPAWRAYVATNTRVVDRILGVSIAVRDLAAAVERYTLLGFALTRTGDAGFEATCPRGTFVRLETGERDGLRRLYWGVRDREALIERTRAVGLELDEDRVTALGVPMEFRSMAFSMAL